MAKARPLTQKEIRAKKAKGKVKTKESVTIHNISSQLITINVRQPKGLDFYIHSRDVHLKPGVSVKLPVDKLWSTQLDRLQKRRMITVTVNADKEAASKKLEEAREARKNRLALKAKKTKKKSKVKAKAKAKPKASKPEESPDGSPDNPEGG